MAIAMARKVMRAAAMVMRCNRGLDRYSPIASRLIPSQNIISIMLMIVVIAAAMVVGFLLLQRYGFFLFYGDFCRRKFLFDGVILVL